GLAVFLRPLQEAHGWSNAAVSGASGLYFAVAGVTSAVVGPRIDRRGPLRFQLAGVLLIAFSVSLVGLVEELWQLYAVYVVLATGYGLAAMVGTSAILNRWFVARRARAVSIATTGSSAGGMVLAPIGAA